jgi:CheY-like chemotaxis protein
MNDPSPDILLVEDDQADIEIMLYSVRKHGLPWRIHIARDGVEALDFLLAQGAHESRRHAPQPRMVLLDLKLPNIGGLDVLRRLKSEAATRSIPIVVMSSSIDENDLRLAYQLGANSYVRKDLDFERFQETVQLLGRYWLDANVPPPDAAEAPPREDSTP